MNFDAKTMAIVLSFITSVGWGGKYGYEKIQEYSDLKAKQKYSEEIISNYDTLLSDNLRYKFKCGCK